MKMCFVVYCDAADEFVIDAFKKAGIREYTKLEEAHGEGTETVPKLGTHVWPGKNNVLMVALEKENVGRLRAVIGELKKEHPRAGVRGFIMPLEEGL
jgi:hypothetical protein